MKTEVVKLKNGKGGRPPVPRRPRVPLKPGYSGLEMTSTELGDLVEAALVRKFGWTPLVGALAGKVRQGPFDMIDENGMYVEVKACSVYSAEYKVKSSEASVRRKVSEGHRLRLEAGADVEIGTVIAIVDRDQKGRLKAWVYRRPGVGCYRLGASGIGWEYVGKAKVL